MYLCTSTLIMPLAAPSKPRHLTVTRILTDGFEINWIPPQQPNGSVRYELNYGTNTTVFSTVVTVSDDTYYNLTGLQQNTTYYIRVVAVNHLTFSGPARTEGEWITATTLEQIETLRSEWCFYYRIVQKQELYTISTMEIVLSIYFHPNSYFNYSLTYLKLQYINTFHNNSNISFNTSN